MRDSFGGYTIVEIMMFLAISTAIFLSAQFVFQGSQGRTQFEQGMRDVASKFQQYVAQVSTSIFPGAGQYTCTVSGTPPRTVLTAGSASVGSNQDCLFLGRAFQVVPLTSSIYIYTVLGNAYLPVNGSIQGDPVTSFYQANPEPAFSGGADLTEQYDTPWAKLLSSKITNSAGTTSDSDLVGFYNSLQDGYFSSGAAGAQSVITKGYNFTSDYVSSVKSAAVKSCIEEQNANGATCANTPQITQWTLCFQSAAGNQTASIITTGTPAGITTNIDFSTCS